MFVYLIKTKWNKNKKNEFLFFEKLKFQFCKKMSVTFKISKIWKKCYNYKRLRIMSSIQKNAYFTSI